MSRTADVAALATEVDQAVQVFRDGHPVRAVRALKGVRRRAQRLGDDRAVNAIVARTFMSQSAAEFDLNGDREAALRLLLDADELAARADDHGLRGTIQAQRALVVLRSGDTRAALRAFDEAAAWMDVLPVTDRIVVLLNRGVLLMEVAALDRAEADLTRCVALCDEAGETRLGAMARHNLGYVAFLAGRLPRALALMQDAAEPHPVARLDHARVLREAGLVRDADTLLEQAAAAFRQGRLQQDLGETELVRAECALVDGDLEEGRRLAVAARRRFTRRGNVRWERKAELLLLRLDRLAADDRSPRSRRTALLAVAERADALQAASRKEGRSDIARRADLLAQECRLLAGGTGGAGGSAEAAPTSRAAPRGRAGDPLPVRLQVREVRARVALAAGDRTRAAAEVRRGLGELGAYQHSFGSLDLRSASAVHGGALAKLGLEIALRSGSPAAVLHVVEQARAVSTRLPSVRPPRDPRTAGLLAALRRVEEEARALEGEVGVEERLAGLRAQAARLQGDIRARAWQVEGERGEAAAAPRSAQIRDGARQTSTTFATLARHQGRWVAVALRGSGCTLHELAPVATVSGLVRRVRADLDALAMPHLPSPLREAVRSSLALDLTRLDALLLAPLRIGGRPVVVSCSGDLLFLPWGLLPSRSGLATVVTPSAATWLASVAATRPDRPRVAVVAGPDLRCAGDEARRVAAGWGAADVLTDEQATAGSLHAALTEHDLVHVAAHGRHRADNPLFSSVRMSDGDVYAYEIDAPGGLAGCLVLSACEAGLVTPRPGEESLGLAHVFLQLGTRCVVAGVARVADDLAAMLMEQLHGAAARGTDVATALAEAQREAPGTAGFVCFGGTW